VGKRSVFSLPFSLPSFTFPRLLLIHPLSNPFHGDPRPINPARVSGEWGSAVGSPAGLGIEPGRQMDFGAFSAKIFASRDSDTVFYVHTSLHALWPALAVQHTGMVVIRQEVAVWFQAV